MLPSLAATQPFWYTRRPISTISCRYSFSVFCMRNSRLYQTNGIAYRAPHSSEVRQHSLETDRVRIRTRKLLAPVAICHNSGVENVASLLKPLGTRTVCETLNRVATHALFGRWFAWAAMAMSLLPS